MFNKKNKDAADAELKRLRAAAKIEYLGKDGAPAAAAAAASAAAPAPASVPAPAPAASQAAPAQSSSEANDRGVAGLK
ncbi:hypothetical protein [Janthinobacterium sp. GW456W]|uniref:hypothetical protein n=1 Tax=Janthinobacterium sp. GW456W TaxID=1981505 RepID=UPI000A325ED3|nr:hypothetical protein [Janthinobacterium sp. GW456W]